MSDLRTAAQQALDALLTPSGAQACSTCQEGPENEYCCRMEMWSAVDALRAVLAQQEEPNAHGYASRLAVAIWEKHYKDTAPQWKPFDDLMGVLTQIDNMTSGLTRLAQQAEPVEDVLLSAAGLALDALEHDRQAAARAGRSISMLSSRAIEELRGAFRAALAQQDELQPMPPEQRQRWEELAAMPQQAEPVQEPAFHGFMSDDGTQVDVCFSPSAPRKDGTYATAYYTAPPQRPAKPVE